MTGRWLSWLSPLFPVWLWHALFDGTPLCRCAHSRDYREIRDDRPPGQRFWCLDRREPVYPGDPPCADPNCDAHRNPETP